MTDLDVFHIRIHGQGDVGNQRPGCGRPDQEVGVLLAFEFRFDVNGRILNVTITERDFVRRQRRAAARAVELDLETLVDQAFLEIAIQRPPDRFDVFVFAGDVGMLHVHPVAHARGEVFPHVLCIRRRIFGIPH